MSKNNELDAEIFIEVPAKYYSLLGSALGAKKSDDKYKSTVGDLFEGLIKASLYSPLKPFLHGAITYGALVLEEGRYSNVYSLGKEHYIAVNEAGFGYKFVLGNCQADGMWVNANISTTGLFIGANVNKVHNTSVCVDSEKGARTVKDISTEFYDKVTKSFGVAENQCENAQLAAEPPALPPFNATGNTNWDGALILTRDNIHSLRDGSKIGFGRNEFGDLKLKFSDDGVKFTVDESALCNIGANENMLAAIKLDNQCYEACYMVKLIWKNSTHVFSNHTLGYINPTDSNEDHGLTCVKVAGEYSKELVINSEN